MTNVGKKKKNPRLTEFVGDVKGAGLARFFRDAKETYGTAEPWNRQEGE